MADDFGYHIDHHGSLVRPASLLAARAAGLGAGPLAAVTDEAVTTLAHQLRRLTLNALSDGQFRRGYFESVVHDQVAGFGPATGPLGRSRFIHHPQDAYTTPYALVINPSTLPAGAGLQIWTSGTPGAADNFQLNVGLVKASPQCTGGAGS